MDERTRLGLGIAPAAAVLGVTGDGLLRLLPWGLNVPLLAAFFARRHSDALTTGFLAVALLNARNPDSLIVRTNLGRADAGRRLDAPYLAAPSADAVPPLTAALPTLPEGDRGPVAAALKVRCTGPYPADWRTYNLPRDRAREAVGGLRAEFPARARGSQEGG
ncbi:MAG: hypothetical protein AVDCRST_MAG25-1180 [uncultured Rubrobacteraceae bacterium]|uniref:Uncharacterized protein n=1 Tax=uncultured Rubrobacteraceae bacterium TaxID=349277 RepID=A0A6J4R762_9ACTN|nr:MAG: hypothetical protein AVDCRST_MAG25-1180 [uncultured Rubrobacteraceae bacterium]